MAHGPIEEETHKCAFTRKPVSEDNCRHYTSLPSRNETCCAVSCTSPWRACSKCILLPENERFQGKIDPETGLCPNHGGGEVVEYDRALPTPNEDGEVRWIDINAVYPLENQPRKYFDPEKLQALAGSIGEIGQQDAGKVRPHPTEPDKYILTDGERRWRAAIMAGKKKYKAEIDRTSYRPSEVLLLSAVANFNREGHTPHEEVMIVARLLDAGYSGRKIAESLGQHQVWVSQRKLIFERSTKEFLELMEKKHVPISIAKEICDLPDAEQVSTAKRYLDKDVNFQAIQRLSSKHRRSDGRARKQKPSDILSSSRKLALTSKERLSQLRERLSLHYIQTSIPDQNRDSVEEIVRDLQNIAQEAGALADQILRARQDIPRSK